MKRNIARIALVVALLFALRLVFDANRAQPVARDLSGLERAIVAGKVANLSDDSSGLSVWSKDFAAIEPELRLAVTSDDDQIKLMHGNDQVGVFTKRAGIVIKDSP